MIDKAMDSFFDHLFFEEGKENARYMIVSPNHDHRSLAVKHVTSKLARWNVAYKIRWSQPRIDIGDVTIVFVVPSKDVGRGFLLDAVFILAADNYTSEQQELIDYALRPFAVVIG